MHLICMYKNYLYYGIMHSLSHSITLLPSLSLQQPFQPPFPPFSSQYCEQVCQSGAHVDAPQLPAICARDQVCAQKYYPAQLTNNSCQELQRSEEMIKLCISSATEANLSMWSIFSYDKIVQSCRGG